MKLEKSFHIKIQQHYCINEPSSIDAVDAIQDVSKDLGGLRVQINYHHTLDIFQTN